MSILNSKNKKRIVLAIILALIAVGAVPLLKACSMSKNRYIPYQFKSSLKQTVQDIDGISSVDMFAGPSLFGIGITVKQKCTEENINEIVSRVQTHLSMEYLNAIRQDVYKEPDYKFDIQFRIFRESRADTNHIWLYGKVSKDFQSVSWEDVYGNYPLE